MKRYLLWIGVVYVLLLLLPLPLLGKLSPSADGKGDKSPSASSSSASDSGQGKNDTFRLLNTETGKVEEIGVREFLIGVVAVEMYPTYHTEALKAQAVASYTYYCVQRNRHRSTPDAALKGADFADRQNNLPVYYTQDELKERWGKNYATYSAKLGKAVDAVLGKRITYNGELITAVYHAISAGTTEDAAILWGTSYPYLKPVASPGDKLSPAFESIVTLKPEEFSSKLKKSVDGLTFQGEADTWLNKDVQTSASGTVTRLTVCGKALTGAQVREALSLRSACFSVTYGDGSFRFTVWGYGHDVGMSQYGADYLARQGSTYDEILRFYYTGVTIE